MIIGSGLIAKAFTFHASALKDICIYAAGVSNSLCNDDNEFLRDQQRLYEVLKAIDSSKLLVYFSTCSIDDPSQKKNRYVNHKSELERFVERRDRYLVVRLPQVAGFTPNPHTLLNYLYARISRSERFDLWRFASRNVIDVEDAALIVLDLIRQERVCCETINVASPISSTMYEIIETLERVTRCRALYNIVDRGATWSIDTQRISASISRCQIRFDDTYLIRTIEKYYGRYASH